MLPDPNIADAIERQAEAAANEDTDETQETAPESSNLVDVNLGGVSVKLPADAAPDVRRAFDSLAGKYGSELETLRARAYAQPQVQYVTPAPAQPTQSHQFESPNPDLLFQDKKMWDAEFARKLEQRLAAERAHAESLVQTSLGIVQQELARRENARAAENYESQLFDETMEKHPNLAGKETFFFSVMDEIYNDIRHLEAPVAYDRAAEIAESRWNAMAGAAPVAPAPRPATPRLLTGGRSAGGADAAPPKRVSISDYITARQDSFLSNKAVHKPGSR